MKVKFTRSVNAPVDNGVAKKGNVYDLPENLAQDLIGQGSCELTNESVTQETPDEGKDEKKSAKKDK